LEAFFSHALSSIELPLTIPEEVNGFDPGGAQEHFQQMTEDIVQRPVLLVNYGLAWNRIVHEARNQVRRMQGSDLDPSAYPDDSYTILLRPNGSNMLPVVAEMDNLYDASNTGTVNLDVSRVFAGFDVEVSLHKNFFAFEKKELERQRTVEGNKKKEEEVCSNSIWDPITKDRISKLYKDLKGPAASFICQTELELAIKLRITQGLRTFAEQDALYAKGRTVPGKIVTNAKGGQSYHNYGLAFDVVEIKNGQAIWNTNWSAISKIGIRNGFEWGGDFKSISDKPHFQMTLGYSIPELLTLYNSGKW